MKLKKILLFLLLIADTAFSTQAFDKYTLDREDLPLAAREFLDEYFPKAKISMIKVDKHLLKKTDYDVKLVNGSKIEFSNSGKWTSVDCKTKEVPQKLLLKAIRNYIGKNFPQNFVTSIEKKASGYEIGLDDGTELKFNLLGGFKSKKTEE
jgi:hypothetical protein